jgi:hypothetical protein
MAANCRKNCRSCVMDGTVGECHICDRGALPVASKEARCTRDKGEANLTAAKDHC